MRIMALDIGRVRTGIAATDAQATIASPVKVMPSQEVFDNSKNFRYLIEDYDPDLLVVGLPVSMGGDENEHAKWVREQAERISKFTGLKIVFQDERLSSTEAKRILRESGMSERDMRGKVDMVAASVILQTYIDGLNDKEQDG